MKMNRIVVIYSGGLDSTVLLAKCIEEFDSIVALNFAYGSKHNQRERQAARKVCKALRVQLFEYDLPPLLNGEYDEEGSYHPPTALFKSDLLISGGEIPDGDYNADNMGSTVVPFRNGVMLSLATGFAASHGFNIVAIANHSGDHDLYPDCCPGFIKSYREAIRRGTGKKVELVAPFTHLTKADIVKLGVEIDAPLGLTWSCYKGGERHCGICGTCRERIESFVLADVFDPTEYNYQD